MCCILSPFMGELQFTVECVCLYDAVSYPPLWGNYNFVVNTDGERWLYLIPLYGGITIYLLLWQSKRCCILSPFMGELQFNSVDNLFDYAVSYPPLWGNYNRMGRYE